METAKIRIGKDFTILWRIYKKENGEKTPYMLAAGKENYILRLWTPYGKQEITRFEIDENTIQFDFLGKDQKHLGNYSLELVERKNAIGMVTVDTAGFTLVAFSRYETDGNNSDVVIQDVKLETELGLTPIVSLTIDTEFSETSHNAVSNFVLTERFNKVEKEIKVLQNAVESLDMESVQQAIANKVDKEEGKTLSSNDFTDADKSKLDGIEAGAQKNDYGLSGARTYPLDSINADGTWEMVLSYTPGVPAFLILTIRPDYIFQLAEGQEEQIYDARLKRDNRGIYIQSSRPDVKRYALIVASSVKKLSEDYISDAIARNADVDEKLKTKQDVVEDLAAIRSGAAKGATAVQNVVSSNSNYAGVTREGYEWIIMPKTKKVSEAGDPVDHLSGIADAYDVKQELAKKVDKVSGKQLSTEDFTTALKQKLQSLNNYDDSALSSAINSLQNQINTLVSGNASSAIDTFNEIIAFLNGVKDTQDLAGIIASIEQQIASVNNSLSAELAKKPNKTDLATINGQSLTNGGNIVIEGKNYDAELAEQEQKLTELSAEVGKVSDEVGKKADEQGYYPNLSVGMADNLLGHAPAVEREIVFDATASKDNDVTEDVARIEAIKGNSLVWNQLAKEMNATNWGVYNSTYASQAFDNGEINVTIKDLTLTGYRVGITLKSNQPLVIGHQLLVVGAIKCSVPCRFTVEVRKSSVAFGEVTDSWTNVAAFVTADNATTRCIIAPQGTFTESANTYSVRGVRLFDLTQMFGAGNEPTTIEEFYQRIPMGVDLNAYNEGEVIHNYATGLKSVGFNAWDEQWEKGKFSTTDGTNQGADNTMRMVNKVAVLPNSTYYMKSSVDTWVLFYDKDGKVIEGYSTGLEKYQNACKVKNSSFVTPPNAAYLRAYFNQYFASVSTYKNDVCLHLAHTGYRNGEYAPYWEESIGLPNTLVFADGMKSANSARDEVYYDRYAKKWRVIKRIGEVDMSTLNWVYSKSDSYQYGGYFNCSIPQRAFGTKNLINKAYSFKEANANVDKNIYGFAANNGIVIVDSAYTDAASLKASLQGVMLYYELAEPIESDLDDYLPATMSAEERAKVLQFIYRVSDFGTEQMLTEEGVKSSALVADIVYGVDAFRTLVNLRKRVAALEK